LIVKGHHPGCPWRTVVVSILLLGYWLQAVISLSGKSTTFDELIHVTAGYTYWSQNDYRLQPENGNLPQRFMALPVFCLGYSFPQLKDDPAWHRSEVSVLGRKFFYQSGNDADRLLLWARGMMGLVGVGLGALIYLIARELFDASVALAAVVLFVFCPTMLAYGALATSDMTVTFFFSCERLVCLAIAASGRLQKLVAQLAGGRRIVLVEVLGPARDSHDWHSGRSAARFQ
jgi:4-amino-4-deoxy-L-arabinose transferase-like glycosyltransferase